MTYSYAPLPINHYYIKALDECEVSTINSIEDPQGRLAAWNLFWLSVLSIDVLPKFGKRRDWFKHYTPREGALGAVIADALQDDEMREMVQRHPSEFLAWFEREDHSIYDSYYALHSEVWVQTVLYRAKLAWNRIESEARSAPGRNAYALRRGAPKLRTV